MAPTGSSSFPTAGHSAFPWTPAGGEERSASLVAMLGTLVIMLLLGWALLRAPAMHVRPGSPAPAMQVTFLSRAPVPAPLRAPAPAMPPHPAMPHPADSRPATPRPVQGPAAAPPPPTQAPQAAPDGSLRAQLYTRDGRVRVGELVNPMDTGARAVPPGSPDARPLAQARQVLERPNPIDYKPTRFDKDWASDGTLGQAAGQAIGRATKKLDEMINGKPRQEVRARPPPNLRFNPALAENTADLGSEATGDAYKAAPIPHEDVPGLDGTASRHIRDAMAALQIQASACAKPRLPALLVPVRRHLADLERAEYGLQHGADPNLAGHVLPQQADSAYDLARRALWYAQQQLKKPCQD